MLIAIAGVLLAIWTVGVFTAHSAGGLVHVLLVAAVALVVFQAVRGQFGFESTRGY